MGSTTSPAMQASWQRGLQHAERRQWQEAASCFVAIVSQKPGHVPALLKAADALLQLDRYREARRHVLQAWAHRLDYPDLSDRNLPAAASLQRNRARARVDCRGRPRPVRRFTAIDRTGHAGQHIGRPGAGEAIDRSCGARRSGQCEGALHARRHRHVPGRHGPGPLRTRCLPRHRARRSRRRTGCCPDCSGRADGIGCRRIERLSTALRDVAQESNEDAYLSFALHNELHARGRHEEAWRGARTRLRGETQAWCPTTRNALPTCSRG